MINILVHKYLGAFLVILGYIGIKSWNFRITGLKDMYEVIKFFDVFSKLHFEKLFPFSPISIV